MHAESLQAHSVHSRYDVAAMQSPASSPIAANLRQRLIDAVTATGGWPYYEGRAARLEPTAWAVLALSAAGEAAALTSAGIQFMYGTQRATGLLVEDALPGPNYAWNGLALVADLTVNEGASRQRDVLLRRLLAVKGVPVEDGSAVRQNSRLQAWSWIEGTFSWVEPTAYCLLAVKLSKQNTALARMRIAEAEAVLLDRACVDGGWNYGNSEVLGQRLRPYVPTTALALLAMQDRREHPVVVDGIEWLTRHALSERSTMALALCALCLRLYGVPHEHVLAALAEHAAAPTLTGNVHLTALALYALTAPQHGGRGVALVTP
jgi:hypothetical protein